MIHGIYLKNRPKAKWHLVSATSSPECANNDLDQTRKQAAIEGYEQAEAAIQIFESAFHIPVFLDTVKDDKPVFN
jgi:hypothetical protein